MITLDVQLLGRLCVFRNEQPILGLDATRLQELWVYLVLNRARPVAREPLADMLWDQHAGGHTRKLLRQALWQLQGLLDPPVAEPQARVLLVDSEWVQLNPAVDLRLDVAVFEAAYAVVQGIALDALDAAHAQVMEQAVALYGGDLLASCYQDWCLFERERIENMYLLLLDKLTGYCELHGAYEAGLAFAGRLLRLDGARERTHRQLMRLWYLAGDRTAALRQYARCVAALDQELQVAPAHHTIALYEQICADDLAPPVCIPDRTSPPGSNATLPELLGRLRQMQSILTDVQAQVNHEIHAVEIALHERR